MGQSTAAQPFKAINMTMKIATWNMGYWQHKNQAQKAWDYMENVIAPDVALVQEAVPPTKGAYSDHFVWREIGGHRNWGSGVFSKGLPLQELDFENGQKGAVVAAEVTLQDGSILTAVSLYGLIDQWSYAITTLHRAVSDLTPLLVGKMGRRRVMIGGDFNASVQCDEEYGGRSHRIFFERLEDFGLVDCLGRFRSKPVQTLRHNKSNIPWENDYIFANKAVKDRLASCDVVDDPIVWTLSDHNPVVAVVDL